MQRTPGPLPPAKALLPLIFLLSLSLLALGCGGESSGQPGAQAAADDSSAVGGEAGEDSLAAEPDSLEAAEEEEGGFFARFRRGGGDEEEEEEEIVPVELATVALQDVPSYLSATASLEPEKQVEILAKAPGQIVERKKLCQLLRIQRACLDFEPAIALRDLFG